MTVLVTGGTGFVGSHVAARLAANGRAVRLLVRDPAKLARVPALVDLDSASIDVVVGDVTDPAERRAQRSTAALPSCTRPRTSRSRSATRARAEEVNVTGTRLVVGGAAERELKTAYVSSVSVFGTARSSITIDSPVTDARGGYTRSKVAAERIVRDLQRQGAPVAIVYPSGVLGPDPPEVSATHLGLVGWVRTPPKTTSGCSIVDVRDVALAIERALDAEPARWMLGGTFLTYAELHAAIERVTGVHRRAIRMPAPLLRLAGRAGDLAKRVVPFDYPLTYEAMVMATSASPYDSEATCRGSTSEWRPVDATLADSIRWLAETGHLNARVAGSLAS